MGPHVKQPIPRTFGRRSSLSGTLPADPFYSTRSVYCQFSFDYPRELTPRKSRGTLMWHDPPFFKPLSFPSPESGKSPPSFSFFSFCSSWFFFFLPACRRAIPFAKWRSEGLSSVNLVDGERNWGYILLKSRSEGIPIHWFAYNVLPR